MKRKRRPFGAGRWCVLVACGIIFFGCGAYVGLYMQDRLQSQEEFADMSDKLHEAGASGLAALKSENPDVIGWIKIEGTEISYPVMQTPDNPEYYLHRNFNREYSESGTPFMDAASRIGGEAGCSDEDATWNLMIYGHNMKLGTMFHDLTRYEDKDFWREHPVFTFNVISDSRTEENTYEIFAAARSEIKDSETGGFRYYQYAGCSDRESFDKFVKGVKSESIYDTGITPEYGERLVTLSTCAYHADEGRFYIVGVRKEQ